MVDGAETVVSVTIMRPKESERRSVNFYGGYVKFQKKDKVPRTSGLY